MKQARSSPCRLDPWSTAAAACAATQRLRPGERRGGRVRVGVRVQVDDQSDGWRLSDSRQQPLGQRAAGADHGRNLGVAQKIGEIVAGAGGVGGDGDPAGQHDREVGHAPFRPILGQDQHSLARCEALRREAACDELRFVPGAAPAPRPIDVVGLRPQERALATLGGRPLEHGHQVGAEIGHGHRWFELPELAPQHTSWRRLQVRAMLEARPQRPISRGLRNQRERHGDAGAGTAADEGGRSGCGQPVAGRAGAGLEPGRPLPIGRRSTRRVPTSSRSSPTPRCSRASSRVDCRNLTETTSLA